MKNIKVVSTGRALPKQVVTNDDMSKFVDTNDEWIFTRTGIKQRYKCNEEENESTLGLAAKAAMEAVKKAAEKNVDDNLFDEIGFVIVATSTPDTIFPNVATMVAKELGLKKEVMAFDISVACTGFLYGMKIANGLLKTMDKKYGLVIGSEQLSRIMDYNDRSTCILFGDGAGAAIVTLDECNYYQKIWTSPNKEYLYCNGVGYEETYLHMKGSDVFKFAVTALNFGIKDVLKENNITLEDVDYVVCHQANARIIDHVKKKYPGYEDKFFMNISKYGNTSSASIPIVIDEILESDELINSSNKEDKKPLKLLCVAFGAGLTYSAAYLEV